MNLSQLRAGWTHRAPQPAVRLGWRHLPPLVPLPATGNVRQFWSLAGLW